MLISDDCQTGTLQIERTRKETSSCTVPADKTDYFSPLLPNAPYTTLATKGREDSSVSPCPRRP